MVDQMKAAVKAKRQDLLAGMRDMPDHNLSVRFSTSWALILHFIGFSRIGVRCRCYPIPVTTSRHVLLNPASAGLAAVAFAIAVPL